MFWQQYFNVSAVILSVGVSDHDLPLNERPIIGVLAQELPSSDIYDSYIAASYVKYLEGAGARVIPIWINKDRGYYITIIMQINGILFPGGEVELTDPSGYAAAALILYRLAMKMNKRGDYFPLWGTGMGFQVLTFLSAGQREHRCDCLSDDQAVPLHFNPDFTSSRLFRHAPRHILNILAEKPVTVHYHNLCISEMNFTDFGLMDEWHVLSTNVDLNGLQFISSIESYEFPFFAVMFQPEKNAYEWKVTKNIPHGYEAVQIMEYFANFFVEEARKNYHTFALPVEERESLIYNYHPTYTGKRLDFEQCYFFK